MAVSDSSSDGPTVAQSNARLIERFYAALQRQDPDAMAACYAEDATFKDIAFDLSGRDKIWEMWRMVCNKKVDSTIDGITADAQKGRAHWVARYPFGKNNRWVVNDTNAEFTFANGKIIEHIDHADPLKWARQAYAPPMGEILGRVELLRKAGARRKLKKFLAKNPKPKPKPTPARP